MRGTFSGALPLHVILRIIPGITGTHEAVGFFRCGRVGGYRCPLSTPTNAHPSTTAGSLWRHETRFIQRREKSAPEPTYKHTGSTGKPTLPSAYEHTTWGPPARPLGIENNAAPPTPVTERSHVPVMSSCACTMELCVNNGISLADPRDSVRSETPSLPDNPKPQ